MKVMKTLHDNDSGYTTFYKDVLTEINKIRLSYNVSDSDTSEFIIDKFELWVDEAFYEPELSDDYLATDTSRKIMTMFESSEFNKC